MSGTRAYQRANVTILAISGSLRSASSNTAVLLAMRALAPAGVAIRLFEGLPSLPPFNPDDDGDDPPEAVVLLRRAIRAADGVMISSPEYARGVPGTLKNALDWLVGGAEIPGKPIALVNTSPRATHAQASLALTLETMSARLVRSACVTAPLLGKVATADITADVSLAAALRGAIDALVDVIGTTSEPAVDQ